eukprot:TRINITY_DN53854_c0_g1_i1.p1 TRINITY_DN53854_c0_g1~~TRINITY_DN53854_c0_g1_i1.p1  ORF type:complete len:937 (+),score=156.31 TRINITY_DN53854_c0_g1_i1:74-2884(+)
MRAAGLDGNTGQASSLLRHRGEAHDDEALRLVYFDLLRQLQNAVRTVILTATVRNSCVRCSDNLCLQLFCLVRSCLLAGCRRFAGANPAMDDFLFLLVVPEFTGIFTCDLELVAYLCMSHTVASFVKQLSDDDARVSHFYHECAIIRDEDMQLAFVSSLLALEPVNFHPDSPLLAQQCLSASLDDLRLSPVLWAKKEGSGRLEDCVPAAHPDKAIPTSDLGSLLGKGHGEGMFSAFLEKRGHKDHCHGEPLHPELPGKEGIDKVLPADEGPADPEKAEQANATPASILIEQEGALPDPIASSPDSQVEASTVEELLSLDSTTEKLEEAAQALNETEELIRMLETQGAQGVAEELEEADAEGEDHQEQADTEKTPPRSKEALLGVALNNCSSILQLEDALASESSPQELPAASQGSDASDGHGETAIDEEEEPEASTACSGCAADLGADMGDAFGLSVLAAEPVPKVSLSLRDLAQATGGARPTLLGRRASVPTTLAHGEVVTPGGAPSRPRFQSFPDGHLTGSSVRDASPSGCDDEASDAVSALEGLWETSRKDTARRLMRAMGGSTPIPVLNRLTSIPGLALPDASGSSSLPRAPYPHTPEGSASSARGESPASSTAVSPRGSATSALGTSTAYQDDACSDSDSEDSSRRSVSSASLSCLQESPGACPSPFGVHLEWRLKMKTRLPLATQVSLQRGCCPGCQTRLPPATLFNAPRYCHYLGCYFCTSCHHGDQRVIPARVAERWDFQPRKVCCAAAKYLDLQVNLPLVSITKVKQTKVSSQQVLTEIHVYRQKLTRIKQVVADRGCDFKDKLDSFISQLDAHIARGHEHYAMQDLIRIELQGRSCPLYVGVSRLVTAAVQHIRACEVCSVSGSMCPICAAGAPVFPFEIENFHSCEKCRTVFHRACFLRAGSECPFCLASSSRERALAVASVRAR